MKPTDSRAEAPVRNSISDTELLSGVATLMSAARKKDLGVSHLRNARKAMEAKGCDMAALDLALSLNRLEPAERQSRLRAALRYVRLIDPEIDAQGSLLDVLDDEKATVAPEARAEFRFAEIRQEGYAAGKAGRDSSDHRHPLGTPASAEFFAGWQEGQAALAVELGWSEAEAEEARTKSIPIRKPSGAKARAVEGQRKPGRRKRGGGDAAQDAVH